VWIRCPDLFITANTGQMEAIPKEDMAIVGKVIKAGNVRVQE
jgi:hypothetical protein